MHANGLTKEGAEKSLKCSNDEISQTLGLAFLELLAREIKACVHRLIIISAES